MADKPQIIAWDTCVIIDAIQKTESKWPKIEPIIERAVAGDVKIVVSELSYVECARLNGMNGKVGIEAQHRMIDAWFDCAYVIRRQIYVAVSRLASTIARQHKLSASDAIILATAIRDKATVLHTGDGSVRKKGGRLIPLSGMIGEPPLLIQEPNGAAGTLFADVPEAGGKIIRQSRAHKNPNASRTAASGD